MSKIEIRKATITDLETIQEISITTFKETFDSVNSDENMNNYIQRNFNREKMALEISNPDSAFYLATFEKATIGYFKTNCKNAQTEKQNENSVEIHRIYVLQAFHGKKVGQLMLDEAINSARLANFYFIWLSVWEENHQALNFYSKNGFIEFGKHAFTLGDDVQTDLLLRLEIKNKITQYYND